ncbi:MAG TPA: zeta toxin family protein [Dehalococcoidia bacterium]|nr:zeta toxin family protein [Dehalococcoidia bacterium]
MGETAEVPVVVVLAGPNGAGKTTTSRAVLQGALEVQEFVNADTIAVGLSAFNPEAAAMAAGRIMLARLQTLAEQRASFAFETTLASRSFAPWLQRRQAEGYRFHLIFLSLPSPELAIARVQERVRRGGHHVPDAVVRRRYAGGLRNFFALYRPIADGWRLYDNEQRGEPKLIAWREVGEQDQTILDMANWNHLLEQSR